jgi:hypothetical protein
LFQLQENTAASDLFRLRGVNSIRAFDQSKESGWTEKDGKETIGHHSDRRIVEIKRKNKGELTEVDYEVSTRSTAPC